LAKRRAAGLQRQLNYREQAWLELVKKYEPETLKQPGPIEITLEQTRESETQLRQRQAASLAASQGDEAPYLEQARQAA
jgi:hypothetical protein